MKRFIAILLVISSLAVASDTFRTVRDGDLVKTTLPKLTATYVAYTVEAITSHATTATATSIISSGTRVVQLTSGGANTIATLPTGIVGQKLTIIADPSTACELSGPTVTTKINGTALTGFKELVMTAGSVYEATCILADSWVITQIDGDGTHDAGGTPD
jgi:hypothetical protein